MGRLTTSVEQHGTALPSENNRRLEQKKIQLLLLLLFIAKASFFSSSTDGGRKNKNTKKCLHFFLRSGRRGVSAREPKKLIRFQSFLFIQYYV
jgi:hypothetical protein